MSDFDAAAPPPWRRRLEGVLEYFGLVESESDDPNAEPEPRPEWERVFFATAIPLWASERVHGWWYAAYIVMAAVSGVIELVRWRRRAFDRGRLDTYAGFLQLLVMFALLILLFFGDDTGAGPALVYAVAFSAAAIGAILAVGWCLRWAERRAARPR